MVLSALGTTTVTALAGCNSASSDTTGNSTGSTPTPESNVFETVETTTADGSAVLHVVVSKDADVSTVALQQDGQEIKQKSLGTGTAVDLGIGDLSEGTYDVVAAADGDVVERTSVEFERSFEVRDVILDDDYKPFEKTLVTTFRVEVTNTGNLPVEFTELIGYGDLPDPQNPDETALAPFHVYEDGELISGPSAFVSQPGESLTIENSNDLLTTDTLTSNDLRESGCTGEQRTAKLRLKTREGSKRVIEVIYTLSGEPKKAMTDTACTDGSLEEWTVIDST